MPKVTEKKLGEVTSKYLEKIATLIALAFIEHLLTFIVLLIAGWSFRCASSLEEHQEPDKHCTTREHGL